MKNDQNKLIISSLEPENVQEIARIIFDSYDPLPAVRAAAKIVIKDYTPEQFETFRKSAIATIIPSLWLDEISEAIKKIVKP